jgi:hypothetical protein
LRKLLDGHFILAQHGGAWAMHQTLRHQNLNALVLMTPGLITPGLITLGRMTMRVQGTCAS